MSDRIDRRSFLARSTAAGMGLLGAGALGGLVAACGSSSSSGNPNLGTSTTGTRNGVSAASPRRGGALRFGNESDINSMDPAVGTWDESGLNYARTVYDPLTIIASDGSVQPYLAQSVIPNTDFTVWTITARPGVTFHDGATCDGPAIANSMNHFLSGLLGAVTMHPVAKDQCT